MQAVNVLDVAQFVAARLAIECATVANEENNEADGDKQPEPDACDNALECVANKAQEGKGDIIRGNKVDCAVGHTQIADANRAEHLSFSDRSSYSLCLQRTLAFKQLTRTVDAAGATHFIFMYYHYVGAVFHVNYGQFRHPLVHFLICLRFVLC